MATNQIEHTYHDIQSLGIDKLRAIYAAAGLAIRKKTAVSKIDTIKEMIRALGENPEQLLTREALSRGNITEQTIEDHQLGVLSDELKKLIRQAADSTNVYPEWCYGQDLNLRTPAGKDFPSGRSSQSVEILSPSPLTWLGYRSTFSTKLVGFGLINHFPSTAKVKH